MEYEIRGLVAIVQKRPWRGPERRVLQRAAVATMSLLLAATSAFLTACAGGSSSATPTATATPAVLYASDFSRGLADWQATSGWSIVHGAMQSDDSDDRSVTIPYQPAGPDYTVEFRLQLIHIPANGGFFFLTADQTPDKNGYRVGVSNILIPGRHPSGQHPTLGAYLDPPDAQEPSRVTQTVHDYEPGDVVRTYRVEVRGSTVKILADGRDNSTAESTQSAHLSTGPLRLSCSGVQARIESVRVLTA